MTIFLDNSLNELTKHLSDRELSHILESPQVQEISTPIVYLYAPHRREIDAPEESVAKLRAFLGLAPTYDHLVEAKQITSAPLTSEELAFIKRVRLRFGRQIASMSELCNRGLGGQIRPPRKGAPHRPVHLRGEVRLKVEQVAKETRHKLSHIVRSAILEGAHLLELAPPEYDPNQGQYRVQISKTHRRALKMIAESEQRSVGQLVTDYAEIVETIDPQARQTSFVLKATPEQITRIMGAANRKGWSLADLVSAVAFKLRADYFPGREWHEI